MSKFQEIAHAMSFAHLWGIARKRMGGKKSTTLAAAPVGIIKAAAVRLPRTDDSQEEMHGDGLAAAARLRERSRCQAILSSAGAAANPEAAKALAFNTRVQRHEAIDLLASLSLKPSGTVLQRFRQQAAPPGYPVTSTHRPGGQLP